MRVALDGGRSGAALDLRESDPDPDRLVAAVREPDDGLVDCPEPGPAHEYAGYVHTDVSVPVRTAVAVAARTRGASAPQDEELGTVEAALAETPEPSVDLAEHRRRVAAARETEAGSRERVDRLAGRVAALREREADTEVAEQRLAEAGRELAEAETERLAAEQALDRARRDARGDRDAGERRLELADRAANLRRAARDHLAERHYDAFGAALEAVPGDATAGDGHREYEGDDATAALAVARMAALDAPVVLACGRFGSARAARDCLDAPVLLV
jgi:hypothetical protein